MLANGGLLGSMGIIPFKGLIIGNGDQATNTCSLEWWGVIAKGYAWIVPTKHLKSLRPTVLQLREVVMGQKLKKDPINRNNRSTFLNSATTCGPPEWYISIKSRVKVLLLTFPFILQLTIFSSLKVATNEIVRLCSVLQTWKIAWHCAQILHQRRVDPGGCKKRTSKIDLPSK